VLGVVLFLPILSFLINSILIALEDVLWMMAPLGQEWMRLIFAIIFFLACQLWVRLGAPKRKDYREVVILQEGERQTGWMSTQLMITGIVLYILSILMIPGLFLAIFIWQDGMIYMLSLLFILLFGFARFIYGYPIIEPGATIVPSDGTEEKK